MTAPNHLAGGLVFTGIIASLYSINIFSDAGYLIIIGIGSLLPDIDNPKSLTGKAVYPISKLIARKFSHRTITHSFLFLIAITTAFYYINKYFIKLPEAPTILFFSVFSHLILDMVTVQGVPLFYPFIKNPCVIPGKVEFRLTTGNLKQEGIAFFMFSLLLFTMQDLFAQGFWTKYNAVFNDTEHVAREFKSTNKQLAVDFHYQIYNEHFKGRGLIVFANSQECIILQNKTIHRIKKGTNGQIISLLKPSKTQDEKKVNRINFTNISIDSLNKISNYHFINEAHIFSSQKVDAITATGVKNAMFFNLENEYNLKFSTSLKDSLDTSQSEKLKMIKEIEIEQNQINLANQEYYKLIREIQTKENQLKTTTDLYKEDLLRAEIIKLRSSINSFTLKSATTSLLKLKEKLKQKEENKVGKHLNFNGEIVYFLVPKNFKFL